MAGSTHNTVYMPIFRDLKILLPPLGEQRKIAAILSSVDEAIEKTQAVIDQVQVVKKGLMQELLTKGLPGRHKKFKQTEIGDLPESWDVTALGGILAGIDSGWSPQCESQQAAINEWGVLKVSAVSWGNFRADEHKRLGHGLEPRLDAEVRVGDLLVSRANTRQLVGRAVLVSECRPRLLLSDKILRLHPLSELVTPEFMVIILGLPIVRAQIEDRATGSSRSMKNISQEKLKGIRVPLPPVSEQDDITSLISSISHRLQIEDAFLKFILELKSALMQTLLTGELRVEPLA